VLTRGYLPARESLPVQQQSSEQSDPRSDTDDAPWMLVHVGIGSPTCRTPTRNSGLLQFLGGLAGLAQHLHSAGTQVCGLFA
jgi:hypothetical protein